MLVHSLGTTCHSSLFTPWLYFVISYHTIYTHRNGCSAWVADTFRYLLPLKAPRGPQMSLDAILKLRNLPSPCATKIDVEGSELEVLKGRDGMWGTCGWRRLGEPVSVGEYLQICVDIFCAIGVLKSAFPVMWRDHRYYQEVQDPIWRDLFARCYWYLEGTAESFSGASSLWVAWAWKFQCPELPWVFPCEMWRCFGVSRLLGNQIWRKKIGAFTEVAFIPFSLWSMLVEVLKCLTLS